MGVALVAAEQDPAVLRLAVHQIVGIAETRHVARQLVAGDRPQRHVLVIDRCRGDERAGHRRDARCPHPGRVDHHFALDRAVLGDDTSNLPARTKLDARGPRAGADPGTQTARRRGQGVGGSMRVQEAVAGHPHGPEQRLGARGRHQCRRLGGRHELGVQADAMGPRDAALELLQLLGAGCEP
jgi:hypothetical protein